MQLHELVSRAAARTPDAPALVTDEGVWSFAELEARVAARAAATAPRERVPMSGENRAEWVVAYYGVPRGGGVLVPINHRLADAEQAALAERARREPVPEGTAWLLFTSGTTGTPKAVPLTHRSLLAAARNTALARPVRDDDVFLTPFPLCHVAGYNVLVFHQHGRPAVVLRRFDPAALTSAVRRHGVTVASLAPTMLDSLLDHVAATGATLPTLRLITHGAAPMPPALRRRATHALGVALSEGYGMTELSGNAVFDGRPGPLAEVRLDPATGEILVRGPQVAGPVDGEGWLHTGDAGAWDADGRLRVVDRLKDVVITGGENVMSLEVEAVLHEHPAVAEAVVVGMPDPRWGEAVTAAVVRRADVGEAELVAHVRARLAGFKTPKRIVFVDALPHNASGKVPKDEVRRLLG